MPLFPTPPVPLALYSGDPSPYGGNTASANTAYLVGVTLEATFPLTALQCYFVTGGAGNYDLGIYDVNGNLLTNQGAVASVTGFKKYTLGATLLLVPGNYWLAFWTDNATDSILSRASQAAGVDVVQKMSVSTHLASTLSSLSDTSFKPYIMGLRAGGFS